MLKRLFAAVVCYALSGVGILFMLIAATDSAHHSRFGWLIGSLWCLAWATHLAMAGAWVIDHRLHRTWPALGVVLGVLSFGAPALAVLTTRTGDGLPLLVGGATFLAAVELGLLLPSVLLAVKLVEFHWSTLPLNGSIGGAESEA